MAKATKNLAEAIRKKLSKNPDLAAQVERDRFSINVSEQIYNARVSRGLTQQQLADRVNTRQSVIARLEDADYGSHSLTMLQRIAEVLEMRVEVQLVDAKENEDVGCASIIEEGFAGYFEEPSAKPTWEDHAKWNPKLVKVEVIRKDSSITDRHLMRHGR